MNRLSLFCFLVATLLTNATVLANELPAVVYLDQIVTSEGWREANLTILPTSNLRIADRAAMHPHVPLESLEASSWPKAWVPVVMGQQIDWTRFDRLEFWVMAQLRPPLVAPPKKLAVQFLCPDKEHALTTTVLFEASDTWVHASISTRDQALLKNLNALNIYLAKRWYKGIDSVDFHIGGFRLVRDAGPVVNECHLLTPFPSQEQPQLRLQTSAEQPLTVSLQQDGQELHTLRSMVLSPGLHAVDLAGLNLAQGRYQLVARLGNERHVMVLDWQPMQLEQVNLGQGYPGSNVATIQLSNSSKATGQVKIEMRLDGRVVASTQHSIPAQATSQVKLDWPLKQGEKARAALQIHAGSHYVGGSSQAMHAPDAYASLSPYRAVLFEVGQPIAFRIPLLVAEGSREQAYLRWELTSLHGDAIDTGQSPVTGSHAVIRIKDNPNLRAGLYSLASTLHLQDQAYKKAWTLYFVENPTADLSLSLHP